MCSSHWYISLTELAVTPCCIEDKGHKCTRLSRRIKVIGRTAAEYTGQSPFHRIPSVEAPYTPTAHVRDTPSPSPSDAHPACRMNLYPVPTQRAWSRVTHVHPMNL